MTNLVSVLIVVGLGGGAAWLFRRAIVRAVDGAMPTQLRQRQLAELVERDELRPW